MEEKDRQTDQASPDQTRTDQDRPTDLLIDQDRQTMQKWKITSGIDYMLSFVCFI